MNCGQCGQALAEGARFCGQCGSPVVAESEQYQEDARATVGVANGATPEDLPPPAAAPPPPPPPPPAFIPPQPVAASAPPPPVGAVPAPYPVVYAPPVAQSTNGLSIASLVLGILWLYWIGSILALIFGYVAKGQIDRSGGRQGGRGMAIAGIVLGWIGVGIFLLLIVVGVGVGLGT